MALNTLPTEIIRMIFYIHIHIHFQPRLPLLLTCRLWHNIAISYNLLWEIVTLGHCIRFGRPFGIACDKLGTLASIIRKGNQALNLKISSSRDYQKPTKKEIEQFFESAGNKWMSGIRTLAIQVYLKDEIKTFVKTLEKLFNTSDFQSLTEFSCDGIIPHEVVLRLLQQMEHSALGLTTLDIRKINIPPSISQYPSLLRRISSLYLEFWSKSQGGFPWIELTNLKHLDIYQEKSDESRHLGFSTIVAPYLSSLCIEGDFARNDFFTHEILQNLSRLAISLEQAEEGMFPPRFPILTFLTLKNNSSMIAGWIQANSLIDLTLTPSWGDEDTTDYPDASITPRIMRINYHSTDSGSLKSDIFFDDVPLWSLVEELQITFFEGTRRLPHFLVDVLQGKHKKRRLFPQLRHLAVRYSTAGRSKPSRVEMNARVHQMLSIMYTRMEMGFSKLTTLEVGWHPAQNIGEVKSGEKEWWVTEWRNCLDGIEVVEVEGEGEVEGAETEESDFDSNSDSSL